jgi:hypothetical protein
MTLLYISNRFVLSEDKTYREVHLRVLSGNQS